LWRKSVGCPEPRFRPHGGYAARSPESTGVDIASVVEKATVC